MEMYFQLEKQERIINKLTSNYLLIKITDLQHIYLVVGIVKKQKYLKLEWKHYEIYTHKLLYPYTNHYSTYSIPVTKAFLAKLATKYPAS